MANLDTQKKINDAIKLQKKLLEDTTFQSNEYRNIQEKIANLEAKKAGFIKEQKKTQDEITGGLKSITSQVNKVKIEYEKVLSSAKGSGDYTKQFSSRIGDVLKANQKSVTDDFLKQLDATTSAGTRLIPIEEANRIKDGIRGHFFKRFLDDTTRFDNQYTYLDAAKARDFVQNKYKDFIKGGGLITKSQADAMDEYVEALKYAEGKIFRPGTTGKGRGTIFIQLKEAGTISQLGGAIALGSG